MTSCRNIQTAGVFLLIYWKCSRLRFKAERYSIGWRVDVATNTGNRNSKIQLSYDPWFFEVQNAKDTVVVTEETDMALDLFPSSHGRSKLGNITICTLMLASNMSSCRRTNAAGGSSSYGLQPTTNERVSSAQRLRWKWSVQTSIGTRPPVLATTKDDGLTTTIQCLKGCRNWALGDRKKNDDTVTVDRERPPFQSKKNTTSFGSNNRVAM